jgi:hypothetical protein
MEHEHSAAFITFNRLPRVSLDMPPVPPVHVPAGLKQAARPQVTLTLTTHLPSSPSPCTTQYHGSPGAVFEQAAPSHLKASRGTATRVRPELP